MARTRERRTAGQPNAQSPADAARRPGFSPPSLCLFAFLLWCATYSLGRAQESRAKRVAEQIQQQNRDLSQADREVKYRKMSESSFSFFRGTNHLYWQHHAGKPQQTGFASPRTRIWLHGDLHAENYGAFADSTGAVVYGFNDFDDSLIEDYQYDVWRMAASIVLFSRGNEQLTQAEQRLVVSEFARAYLSTLASFEHNEGELTFRVTKENAFGRLDEFLKDVEEDNSRLKMLRKWTRSLPARSLDTTRDDLEPVTAQWRADLETAMRDYAKGVRMEGAGPDFFQVKDAARRRFSGTGSLGVQRFYVLIEGQTGSDEDDRILDVKEQRKPAAYAFLPLEARNSHDRAFPDEAQRHAVAYRALTRNTDPLLGWTRIAPRTYSVRERSPYRATLELAELNSLTRTRKLAQQWAALAAAHHARSDNDFDRDAIGYSFEEEVGRLTRNRTEEFAALVVLLAFRWADLVQRDYEGWKKKPLRQAPE